MTVEKELPQGWARVTLGQICVPVGDRVQPDEIENLPYIGLEHIERDEHRLKTYGQAKDTASTKSLFCVGDVLYGRLRPNLNKVLLAPFKGICSTDILVLRPTKLIDPRFLMHILSTKEFVNYATSRAKGINLPRLSTGSVMSYTINIPPASEQIRILDALELHSTAITAIRVKLASANVLLSALPAQILSAAVHGELTALWRAERTDSISDLQRQSKSSFIDGYGDLPTSWISKRVEELGSVRKGRVRTPEHHQGPNMRPYLRVANVLEGRIDISDVMKMNFTPDEFERFRLSYGDILLNEGQSMELVGRPAMFRNELDGVCFTNSLIQFRCYDQIVPEFAILVFRHYFHSGVFTKIAKITTNLAHLGAMRFAELLFPQPPIDEQKEIAAIGQTHLDYVQSLHGRISRLSGMVEILYASIRAEAIAGRLVPQDPDDESIEKLLKEAEPLLAAARKPISVSRRQGARMKKLLSVLEAARAASKPLTGQQLFAAAGYPEDAASDLVEKFFLDLRQQIEMGTISRQAINGSDVFTVTEGFDQ